MRNQLATDSFWNSLPPLLSFFALPVSLYLSSSSSLIVKVLFFFGISRKDRPSLISQLWAKAGMAKPSAQSDGKEIFVEARKIKKEYFFSKFKHRKRDKTTTVQKTAWARHYHHYYHPLSPHGPPYASVLTLSPSQMSFFNSFLLIFFISLPLFVFFSLDSPDITRWFSGDWVWERVKKERDKKNCWHNTHPGWVIRIETIFLPVKINKGKKRHI